jgi:hypothetical protein
MGQLEECWVRGLGEGQVEPARAPAGPILPYADVKTALDYVQTSGPGNACQPGGITGETNVRDINNRSPAQLLEMQCLSNGGRLVEQLAIIEIASPVVPHPLEVLQTDRGRRHAWLVWIGGLAEGTGNIR